MTDKELMQHALEVLEQVAGAMPFPVALQVRAALRERLARASNRRKAMSIGVMLFNPFTGKPRHPSDIESDPKGILVWDGEEPLRAYKPRQWQGLTDEEISAVDWKANETLHDFGRAIEAKLREKNA